MKLSVQRCNVNIVGGLAPCKRGLGAHGGLPGQSPGGGHDGLHLVPLAVAVQDQVAPGLKRVMAPVREAARQRLHGNVVGHEQPAELDPVADDRNHLVRRGGGRVGVDIGIDHMRRHCDGQARHGLKRQEIRHVQRLFLGLHDRQFQMAVRRRAAMTRNVLDDRQNAAVHQPRGRSPRDVGDPHHVIAVAAVREDLMRVGAHEVQHRGAVPVDPDGAQFVRDDPVAQIHRLGGLALGQLHLLQRWQPVAPVGRSHPGDAASFLIDEDRGVAAHGLAQFGGQPRDLLRVFDIAREQDETPRVRIAKEVAFPTG